MSPPPLSRTEALDLLAWYVETGVDIALEETPVDRFAPVPVRVAEPPAPPVQTVVRTAAPLEARQIAHRCQMLKHLASSSR